MATPDALVSQLESLAAVTPTVGQAATDTARQAKLTAQWRHDMAIILGANPVLAAHVEREIEVHAHQGETADPTRRPIYSNTRLPFAVRTGAGGLNRATGKYVTGWAHVSQSIFDILSTPIGSRVMRRNYGSRVFDLIDRPQTLETVMEVYLATAEAIDRWEPRFKLKHARIVAAGADGHFALAVYGAYFPRGHLGDFTEYEEPPGILVAL